MASLAGIANWFFALIKAGNLNWDLALWGGIFLSSILYTVFLGRRRVLLYLTAIYVTLGVLAYAPFIGRIPEVADSPHKIIYFIAAFIILFFALSRGVLGEVFTRGGYVASFWQVLLLAFFQLGLLTSVVFSFLPKIYAESFSFLTRVIFSDNWARFAWLFLPIVLMAALARQEKDE
ncbi:MAG: hypothetical protein HY982_01185 [Candidatus Magasanikbacteria bacterium]|nr:hypothetical protein [Candidatus Magasanikbacteria bacterium]